MFPDEKTLINGLRQYTMHLYKNYVSLGYTHKQATKRLVGILSSEINYFEESKPDKETLIKQIEKETDENIRFKLIQEFEETEK